MVANAFAENGKPTKNTLLPVPAQATVADSLPKQKPQLSLSNAFTNSYYWRGITFNEGLMLQPSATVTYKNWFGTAWSNVVAFETGTAAFVPEFDFTVGYTYECNNLTVSPQANVFFYPSNSTHVATVELGAEMSYETQNVGFYLNPNVDAGDNKGGVYIDYGLFKSGDIDQRWSYDARFLLGWGNKTFRSYYEPVPVVETNANPMLLKPESMKSMRLQGTAVYRAGERLSLRPQLIVFRNFMTEYTLQHDNFRLNGSLTCAYAF